MPDSIFAGEIAAGLQDVENCYVVCRGLFGRARQINTQPREEGESAPNPSARAVAEFSRSRLQGPETDGVAEVEAEEGN